MVLPILLFLASSSSPPRRHPSGLTIAGASETSQKCHPDETTWG